MATYTHAVQEVAHAALTNIAGELDKFLLAIRDDMEAALKVEWPRPVVSSDLEFLRETVTEHLRSQLLEACEAAAEFTEADPLKAPPVPAWVRGIVGRAA